VYGSAGRGFETPAIGELSPSPGAALRPVRPKSLWTYEVGARRIVANRVRLEGAAFVSAVRGEFVPVTVAGVTFPENASRSRNAGIELGATALATPWLDLSAGYAFLDMELRDYTTFVLNGAGGREEVDYSGKRMPAVPRHRITGEAQLRILDRISVGFQGEWQGMIYVETGNRRRGTWYFQGAPGQPVQQVAFSAVPARALFHLNSDLRIGPATAFARVENLFGEKYVGNVVANETQARFYDPGTPASVSFGVSLSGWSSPRADR
jgi:iron complex outermembrane receptor protein